MKNLENDVKLLITDLFNIENEEVKGNTCFTDDLHVDSLDVIELIMKVEETYGITIPDEKIGELITVDNLVSFVATEVEKK